MKVILEFTQEELKAVAGKTIGDLINGSGKAKAPTKKKEEVEEDEELEEDEDTEEAELDDDEAEVDEMMIKEAINKATKAGNTEKVRALFAKFKAKTVAGLKTEHYDKFYAALTPLTKKAK